MTTPTTIDKFTQNATKYRILWPRPYEASHREVSHWIFSMNGADFIVVYKDGRIGRGFQVYHNEFEPQWQFVNNKLKPTS